MSVYKNRNMNDALSTVEVQKTPSGQNVIFYLHNDASAAAFKEHLRASGLGLLVVAQTHVDGKTALVAEGTNIQEPLFSWLGSQGSVLDLSHKTKTTDPWILRSILGVGGQSLQLASAFMRPETALNAGKGIWKRVDVSTFVFAAANMTANIINLIYKGHNLDDPHQLKSLKEQFNRSLTPHMQAGELAPSTDDSRKKLRDCNEPKKDAFNDFMRHHSVNVGELGLRYIGAFGMAYPATGWHNILKGQMPTENPHKLRVYAGLGSIVGKTMALGSKVPDPYNPAPKSWLDPIREKFAFLGGGLVEAGAFSAYAYDCFFNTKPGTKGGARGIMFNGEHHRDWLGGIGGSMFVAGYIVRSWAKYGERNVDMEELYAHVSDTLAKVTPEKLPQLLADTAAEIKNHFKERTDLDFGTIYTELTNDLKRYHHIDIHTLLENQQETPKPDIMAKDAEHQGHAETDISKEASATR